MCIFTGPIHRVARTRIFARALPEGRQALAYEMTFAADAPVAMVLPLPVPPSPPEDAVSFVDLSGYPRFFVDLAAEVFPQPQASRGFGAPAPAALTLAVHRVGSFVASFVPTTADFARLDPRFRLSAPVLASLPEYADWGFAVFELSPEPGADEKVHPMALTFPRRDPSALYFPTRHVHDGQVHTVARFDHDLFLQPAVDAPPPPQGAPLAWLRAPAPAGFLVDVARTQGLVAPGRHLRGRSLSGDLPNRDQWVADPGA